MITIKEGNESIYWTIDEINKVVADHSNVSYKTFMGEILKEGIPGLDEVEYSNILSKIYCEKEDKIENDVYEAFQLMHSLGRNELYDEMNYGEEGFQGFVYGLLTYITNKMNEKYIRVERNPKLYPGERP